MSLLSIVAGALQDANAPARAVGSRGGWWGFWWIWAIIAIIVLWAIFGFGGGYYRNHRGGPRNSARPR